MSSFVVAVVVRYVLQVEEDEEAVKGAGWGKGAEGVPQHIV